MSLKRSGIKRSDKQMARRAASRDAEDQAYWDLWDEIMATGPDCQVCPALRLQEVDVLCLGRAAQLHHLRKRSSGGAIAHPMNVIPSCSWGNVHGVENNPIEAEAAGLVIREGHPMWELLSARLWRKLHVVAG